MKSIVRLAAVLWIAVAPAARAWDSGGHFLVMEIALRRVSPETRKALGALPPLLDNRFNGGKPYNPLTAAAWLDDIRTLKEEYPWARWHYVDLPCGKPPRRPPAGEENALFALDHASAVLRNAKAEPRERAHAFAQLIHIVGDIHQPLHTATRDDRGGNGYLLVPLAPLPPGLPAKPFNLHQFWDTAYRFSTREGRIVELWQPPPPAGRPQEPNEEGWIADEATRLLAQYPPESLPRASSPPDPWRWIVESHELACRAGWPPGPPPQAYEAARLTPAFVEETHRIAGRQIVLAGCRLAAWLDRLFGNSAGSPPTR